jgi:hypothetical protein
MGQVSNNFPALPAANFTKLRGESCVLGEIPQCVKYRKRKWNGVNTKVKVFFV